MKGACRDRARQGRCRSKEAGLAAKQAFSFFLFLFLVVLFFRGRRGLFPFHVGGSTPRSQYASCCPSCDLVLQECRVLSVDVVMVGCTLPLSAREGTLPQPIVLAPVQWMVPDYQDVAKAEQGVALCVGIAVGTRVDVSGEKVSGVQRGCGVWSRFLGRTGGCGAGSLIEARARVLCRRLSLLARVVAQGDPNFGGQPSWVVCIRRGGIWLRRRQS